MDRPSPRAALTLSFLVLLVSSACTQPQRVEAVGVARAGDRIVVTVSGTTVDTYLSTVDGRHWEMAEAPGTEAAPCVPGEPTHCYRVRADGIGVEESIGDGWRTAWEVSDGRREFLSAPGSADPALRSRGLAVLATGSGHVVIVADGPDGVARRDPAGSWERIGFPAVPGFAGRDAQPLTGFGRGLLLELPTAIVLAILVGGLGLGLLASRRRCAWERVVPVLIAQVLLAPVALALSGSSGPWIVAGATVLTVGCGLIAVRRARLDLADGAEWGILACSGAVVALTGAAYLGWTVGFPDRYGSATMVAGGGVGVALLVALGLAFTGAADDQLVDHNRQA